MIRCWASRSSLLAPPSIAAIGRGAYCGSETLPAAGTREPGGWAQHFAKPLLGAGRVGVGASQLHESPLNPVVIITGFIIGAQ